MNDFIENTYLEMADALAVQGTDPAQPQNLADSLAIVAAALTKLRDYIVAHPFETEAEEIIFFKHTKPRFYSWNIYLVEKHTLLRGIPNGTSRMNRKYFLAELKYVTRMRARHISLFRYYQDNPTYHDRQYFLRANLEPLREGQEYSQPDPEFTTNMDYLFSKFRALDMLEDFIIEQIQILENNNSNTPIHNLRWTGDKVNLVELAYGLFYTAQLNDGKADIMDIIAWLRDTLSVSITREQAYRTYLAIRRRKAISYTRFLDAMQESLSRQIEESFK